MQRIRTEDGNLVEIFEMADSSGTLTDASGTTDATPATSTAILAANTDREYFMIQNNDASNALWINFTAAAVQTQPSIQIAAGGIFEMSRGEGFVTTEAINAISAIASHPYTLKWA